MAPLLGLLAPLFGTVIDRLIPDTAEAEQIKSQIALQAASAEVEIQKGILDLAKEDAKSGVGGFRWGAGWLCVLSLAYSWLLYPLLQWALVITESGVQAPPALDTSTQYVMLTGMLGLASVRSFDLKGGVRK